MAGNYPDVPAPRMAYDRDGSVGFTFDSSNNISDLNTTNLQYINNENENQMYSIPGSGSTRYVGVIFPQLRDIAAVLWQASPHDSASLYTSVDTTNGLDGTWVNHGTTGRINATSSNGSTGGALKPDYRNLIATLSVPGVKAVRIRASTGYGKRVQALHIYGTIATGETPDRLRMWHPTLDEPLDDNTAADGAHLDWGDVPRGSSQDRQFRLKNNSATLTANSISITSGVLTNTSPTLESQITYSDGGAFASSINIGNLAPGAISPVITVRRNTSTSATLSVWALRTAAEAGSWS